MAPHYEQKFREEYLKHHKLKAWVAQDRSNPKRGYCKYCKCSLNGKLHDMLSHAETKKHLVAASIRGPSWRKLEFLPIAADKVKKQEAALALFTCQHTANNTIDHLSDLCRSHFDDGNKIRMHRSKCSIIQNVLSPYFVSELRKDISDSKYSLLIDESTDVGIIKLLGIVIIYFSKTKKQIVSTFLSLAEVEEANAEGITKVILQQLNIFKLEITNLMGIGTDNANVMVGNKKSVFVELKKLVPNLFLIKCVCHSVQLAVTHSWKESMPQHLEFLVNETYNWFSRSYARQQNYKYIFEAINDESQPLKITNICDTRWLSIETSISRIVEQWTELKTHFGIVKNYDKCYMAERLFDLYENELNLGFFLFLKPILSIMQTLNKSFQSSTCDPTKLLNDIEMAVNYLKQFVINPTLNIDVLSTDFEHYVSTDTYLGYSFESHLKELQEQMLVDKEAEAYMRTTCTNFVTKLIMELKKRLPENYKMLKLVRLLSIENVLNHKKDNLLPLLTTFGVKPELIDVIIGQYFNITFIKWTESSSTTHFWSEVLYYKDSAGNNPFQELAKFAIDILTLPWSNADVERVFSQLNIVKTKLRNRLITNTVNSVLHVRYGLKLSNKCCFEYEIPAPILRKIGTVSTYDKKEMEEWLDVFA